MEPPKTTHLPDPRTLSAVQLIELFVDVSRIFNAKLHDGELEELHDLRFYMKAVCAELERKQLAEIEKKHGASL